MKQKSLYICLGLCLGMVLYGITGCSLLNKTGEKAAHAISQPAPPFVYIFTNREPITITNEVTRFVTNPVPYAITITNPVTGATDMAAVVSNVVSLVRDQQVIIAGYKDVLKTNIAEQLALKSSVSNILEIGREAGNTIGGPIGQATTTVSGYGLTAAAALIAWFNNRKKKEAMGVATSGIEGIEFVKKMALDLAQQMGEASGDNNFASKVNSVINNNLASMQEDAGVREAVKKLVSANTGHTTQEMGLHLVSPAPKASV